jgi:hypothetical protein
VHRPQPGVGLATASRARWKPSCSTTGACRLQGAKRSSARLLAGCDACPSTRSPSGTRRRAGRAGRAHRMSRRVGARRPGHGVLRAPRSRAGRHYSFPAPGAGPVCSGAWPSRRSPCWPRHRARARLAQKQFGRDHSHAVVAQDFGDPGATFQIGSEQSVVTTRALRVTVKHAPSASRSRRLPAVPDRTTRIRHRVRRRASRCGSACATTSTSTASARGRRSTSAAGSSAATASRCGTPTPSG